MKIKYASNKKVWFIFNIPILKQVIKNKERISYLFSLIPISSQLVDFNPLVSVVMPVYNSERYLRDAIDSILGQTYSNFEFLIINDGSSDNSSQIIKEYKDQRIKFFDFKENKGIVERLNFGLNQAKGKYIARMDSDDLSLSKRLEKQVYFLENHKDVGILGTWFYHFGINSSGIIKKYKNVSWKHFCKESPLGHPTVMFRKNLLEKYNLYYDKSYQTAEDYELWFRFKKYTKLCNLQEILLNYRVGHNSISLKNGNRQMFLSSFIKFMAQSNMSKNIKFFDLNIDDTNLLKELRSLGQFSYIPNSGNMGDMLIASSTMRWFDTNKLNWKRLKQHEDPVNLVYGGGGGWLAQWIDDLSPILEKMKKAKRIVILPSSFCDVKKLIDILDERFVIFCREPFSYNYLLSQKTKAKIYLDHDMAFRLRGAFKPKWYWNWHISKDLKTKIHNLKDKIKAINKKDVCFFRADNESLYNFDTDLDLSESLGWFGPYSKRETIDKVAYIMISVISFYDTIKTDRLHVAICASLLGKKVYFYNNNYYKNKGVYQTSLQSLPNITFIDSIRNNE